MRKVRKSDFVGKTIVKVDAKAENCITFEYEDGSTMTIETAHVGFGLYGIRVSEQTKKK